MFLPLFGVLFEAEDRADLFQIFFRLVEETVEAHRGKVVRTGSVRAESEGNVITRFAHGTVAFVEVGTESDVCGDGTVRPGHGARDVAHLKRIGRAHSERGSLTGSSSYEEVVVQFRMSEEKGHDFAVVAGFIFHAFGRGAVAEIIVARKARGSGQVRLFDPESVVLDGKFVRLGQPGTVFVTGGLLRLVDSEDHGGQKRRLGAREIVSTVGIQHGTVVLDLEKKIVHHALSQVDPAVADKTQNDEVTVPPVHLVESSARYHVTVFEIEQARRINRFRTGLSQVIGGGRKSLDLDVAPTLQLVHGCRHGEVRGKIKVGRGGQLRITESSAIGKRTRQGVPAGRNV